MSSGHTAGQLPCLLKGSITSQWPHDGQDKSSTSSQGLSGNGGQWLEY